MSANNQILIYRIGNTWVADDQDVDTGGSIRIGAMRSLLGIIALSNQYIREHEVEYGLYIATYPQKKRKKRV